MNSSQKQKTLARTALIEGVGLHSGQMIEMFVRPAPAHHGISFVRSDLKSRPSIRAKHGQIVGTQLATTLGQGKATVGTVEHLMAAFQGLGIDNAVVEVSGPEIPVLDGSARIFAEAFLQAGLETQSESQAFVRIKREIEVKMGDHKWARVTPSDTFEVHAAISWDHPIIGNQEFSYIDGQTGFAEIVSARTFGFLKDVEALRRMGLAMGGSLENAIVIGDDGIMNPEGLRYPNEFVRHKVLDAIGDLGLAGLPFQGAFTLCRSGHDLHQRILAEIFADPANYEIVRFRQSQREADRVGSALRRMSHLVASF